MPAMTGLPLSNVLGRTWQPVDVQLQSLTDDQPAPDNRETTMLSQVLRNGRSVFATRLCRVSESRHLKVDVYSMPIVGAERMCSVPCSCCEARVAFADKVANTWN